MWPLLLSSLPLGLPLGLLLSLTSHLLLLASDLLSPKRCYRQLFCTLCLLAALYLLNSLCVKSSQDNIKI